MTVKAVAAAVAFAVAYFVASKIAQKTADHNRDFEFKKNEESPPLSQSERDWTFVHIRDDIGGIHNLLVLANGLLAGILAALVF